MLARCLFLALAVPLLAGLPTSAGARPIAVQVERVPLDQQDGERTLVGRLRYRGGVALSSTDPRFGGFSALLVSADGRRFISVSDAGYWLTGALDYGTNGNLVGVSQVDIARMQGPDGRAIRSDSKLFADAESLASGRDGGLIVAFEQIHRLWLYPGTSARPVMLRAPRDLRRAPANGGIEALTRLNDGRLLAIAEELERGDGRAAWLRGRSGEWSPLTYLTGEGFRPTGAATLANGDVLVLERRFPLVAVRIRYLPAAKIVPGGRIAGDELARFEGTLTLDNMEGIAARRGSDGANLIYLISDDNFRFFQRTLLMMFELVR